MPDVVFVLVAAGLVVLTQITRVRMARAFRFAGRELGGRASDTWSSPALTVDIDGLTVTAAMEDDSQRASRLRFTVLGTDRFPTVDVDLRREPGAGALGSMVKAIGGGDVLIGDPAFDSRVVVRGREDDALAMLNAAARRAVARLVNARAHVRLTSSGLQAECDPLSGGPTLVRHIRNLAELGVALNGGGSVPVRLAKNAESDPMADVRLRNLRALLDRYSSLSLTRETCRDRLSDNSPWIRLLAARGVGPEALGTLADLARSPASNAAVAAEALEDVLTFATRDEAAALCSEIVAGGRGQRRRAVEVLGRLRYAPALEHLARALAGDEGLTATAAARSLALIGGERAEAALLRCLGHQVKEVQLAVVQALGDAGTARAVAPLGELADEKHADGALRRAAQQAVRRIQSRLTGAEAGQLALAEADPRVGALSMVEPGTEEGRLSLSANPVRSPRS